MGGVTATGKQYHSLHPIHGPPLPPPPPLTPRRQHHRHPVSNNVPDSNNSNPSHCRQLSLYYPLEAYSLTLSFFSLCYFALFPMSCHCHVPVYSLPRHCVVVINSPGRNLTRNHIISSVSSPFRVRIACHEHTRARAYLPSDIYSRMQLEKRLGFLDSSLMLIWIRDMCFLVYGFQYSRS